jgi:uncharacterized protein (TIGR02996 family)
VHELLAKIHADPTDDRARLVYADWLLERGDPRGEFIALQLGARRDPARGAAPPQTPARVGRRARQRDPAREDRVPARFPADVHLPQSGLEAVAEDPIWSTVEVLRNYIADVDELLARAPLGALRLIHAWLGPAQLALIARRPLPRLEHAIVEAGDLILDGLPALRRVTVQFLGAPIALARRIFERASARRLEQLDFMGGDAAALAAEFAGQPATIPKVIIDIEPLRVVDGRYAV